MTLTVTLTVRDGAREVRATIDAQMEASVMSATREHAIQAAMREAKDGVLAIMYAKPTEAR
jgi:hypothetical protein